VAWLVLEYKGARIYLGTIQPPDFNVVKRYVSAVTGVNEGQRSPLAATGISVEVSPIKTSSSVCKLIAKVTS
jgi:hypothetical protein